MPDPKSHSAGGDGELELVSKDRLQAVARISRRLAHTRRLYGLVSYAVRRDTKG
jgi:hypothetical protein